jgi:quinohemoprotein ethanol dehydrogenase
MQFPNIKKVWLVALALAVSVSAAAAQDTKALLDASKNANDWLTTGHDYSDQRYSELKQIDASNASRLGLAWYYDTGSDRGTVETTPLVSNGVMYATLPWSVVVALDAATGKEKWRWDPQIPHTNFPPG